MKECVAAGKNCTSTAEAWARETLDKMSKLFLVVEGLTRTLDGKCARFADLVETELSQVRLVITAALSDRYEPVGDAICGV